MLNEIYGENILAFQIQSINKSFFPIHSQKSQTALNIFDNP